MAFKIIWSEIAREDLQGIVRFISKDNPQAAETFGFLLISKVDPLMDFPRLGRVVPETGEENIRELVSRPYRIIYRVIEEKQTIAIVRVWHGARGEPQL
jgi:addiction module RelE/StbE family toxin